MDIFEKHLVIIGYETVDGEEMPIVEEQMLEESDVRDNYEWADEEKTILRLKEEK